MSEEEDRWTVETLRVYLLAVIAGSTARWEEARASIERQFVADREARIASLAALEQQTEKSALSIERRFEAVNEFRAQLGDQQRTFMPRTEMETRLQSISDRISMLERSVNDRRAEGAGLKSGWGWAVAVLAVVLSVVYAFSHR